MTRVPREREPRLFRLARYDTATGNVRADSGEAALPPSAVARCRQADFSNRPVPDAPAVAR